MPPEARELRFLSAALEGDVVKPESAGRCIPHFDRTLSVKAGNKESQQSKACGATIPTPRIRRRVSFVDFGFEFRDAIFEELLGAEGFVVEALEIAKLIGSYRVAHFRLLLPKLRKLVGKGIAGGMAFG